jgi:hypothetical protein
MAKKAKESKPKAQALPGMEDRAIQGLEKLATEYAGIRDERIALNAQEADLKKRVRAEMKKHNRTRYAHDGIEIELIAPSGEEDVKVRVPKKKAEDEDDEEE